MHAVAVDASTNHIITDGYTYDANGNMTNDAVNALTYDAENRAASSADGSGMASYSYGGSNLRVQKTFAGDTTVYIFSGNQVLDEYVGGVLSKEYIYRGTALVAEYTGSTLVYHGHDQLSNRITMDTNGNLQGEQGHYPYGEDWYMTNTTTKWHVTTYERDAESDNDYAKFRVNVNRLGRFLTIDPVRPPRPSPQLQNRYTYVANDPIDRRDPDGRLIFNGCDPTFDTCSDCDPDFGCGWFCDPDFGCEDSGFCSDGGDCSGGGSPPPPPPPPPLPECFCQLKYRSLNSPSRFINYDTHSFWYIQDQTGFQWILSSGPSNPNGTGFLNSSASQNVFSGGADNVFAATWYDSGLSSDNCSGAEGMLDFTLSWPNNTYVYSPIFGPNSNSFAHYLGEIGGFDPPEPPGAWGWFFPL